MPSSESGSLRVLVVEDYDVNQKVALRMLKKLGIEADLAENGEEACAALERETYDLVLMDCEMPVVDGFEATRRIRAREAAGEEPVTIIAMTAHTSGEEERRCRESGMDGFLEKPIRLDTLRRTLAPFLPS